MATKTENLNLIKADENEEYSVEIVNNNLDILDGAYKENKNNIKTISNNFNEYKEETTEKLTNIFTKEEVLKKIEDIIGSAPEALDTINKIAKALGDDPNFATTILTLLNGKVDKEEGKVLTSNDYSNKEKQKLESAYNLRIHYIPVEGENNVFTATVEGITEYKDGLPLCIKLPIDSTGICTLNLNGLGAITIQDSKELKANIPYNIRYEITSNSFIVLDKGGDKGLDTSDATALAEDILINKSAYGANGKIEGAMVDNRAVDITLNSNNQEYTVPKGFHNGLGKIKAVITNLLASVIKYGAIVGGITGTFTGDGTATAEQMLSGAIAYVKGSKIIGNIVQRSGHQYAENQAYWNIGVGGNAQPQAFLKPPLGYYYGDTWIRQEVPDLLPQNILSGKNILGCVGTAQGRNYASGTFPSGTKTINIGFTPTIIIIINLNSSSSAYLDMYYYSPLGSDKITVSGTTFTYTGNVIGSSSSYNYCCM